MPVDLPSTAKPISNRTRLRHHIHTPAPIGVRRDKRVPIPDTPPVEKPLGTLKKYTPTARATEPRDISKNSVIFFIFCSFGNLFTGIIIARKFFVNGF